MKRILVTCFENTLLAIERLLVYILYGKHHQRKKGWKGEYANWMKDMYTRVRYSNRRKEQTELIARLGRTHPDCVRFPKRQLVLLNFRFSQSLIGSEMDDWFEYRFFEHGWRYRWNTMTFWRNQFFNDMINGRRNGTTEILDNKLLFASHWADYLHREWCIPNGENALSREEFLFKFQGKRIVTKAAKGWGGASVRVFEPNELEKAYDYAANENTQLIAEEYFYQKGALHELNETSLNTIRVCTLIIKGKPEVLFAKLRIGGAGAVVDNACLGGSLYEIDVNTGFLTGGSSYLGEQIDFLPNGTPVRSYQIPHWERVKLFAADAHRHASQGIRLIGWDICLSDDELLLIEGNANPAFATRLTGIQKPWRFAKSYLAEWEKER